MRLIPRIDENARVIEFVQRTPGKLALLGVFGALYASMHGVDHLPQLLAILTAMTFFPSRRRMLLVGGTLYWLVTGLSFHWPVVQAVAEREGVAAQLPEWFELASVAATLAFCAAFHLAARRFRKRGPFRRPVLTLLVTYVAAICVAAYAPLDGLVRTSLWSVIVVLSRYIWFLGYSLLDLSSKQSPPFRQQLGHYLPFWGGSATPFPKGAAYMRKIEAKTSEALAVTQLKGVKLLAWALCLAALAHAWELVLHGEPAARAKVIGEAGQRLFGTAGGLGLPTMQATFDAVAANRPVSAGLAWSALVAQFVGTLLSLAVWGHVIIATCRMAGFRALRNTRNPLVSTTLAEFWNRYYYYFKELLVDFFFYPTFLRCFRKRPRLRRAFATIAAAGFGNVLYHFLRDSNALSTLGPWEALLAFRSYVIYGLVLGLAIAVSQDRAAARKSAATVDAGIRRVTGPILVSGFFCVMSVFGQSGRGRTLGVQMDYLVTLLGLA